MKNILNSVLSTIGGISIFMILTSLFIDTPFLMDAMKNFIVMQIFILIGVIAGLVIVNVNGIIEWFNDK